MNRPHEIAEIEATLGCTFTTRELGPYVAFQSPIRKGRSAEELRECDRLTTLLRQSILQEQKLELWWD